MIYFDNSATTPVLPSVLQTYIQTTERMIGNPSSLHRLGSQSTRLLEQSRKQTAELLEVAPEEIYFTSGGTESNNWVLKGTALEKAAFGKHIIVSSVEHASVYRSCEQLAKAGFEISYAPVDTQGKVIVSELEKLIRKDTILVSCMAVNNEIGTIQPISEISDLLKDYPAIHFHVDAVQAIGKVPLTAWLTERVDFASLSAHKFHGPKGVGLLYWRKGRKLASLITGGGQEHGKRSGTENLAGIVAMSRALRLQLTDVSLKETHMTRLRDYLLASLSEYDNVTLFSESTEAFAPHIVCFGLKNIRGEVLVHAFEEKDIYISTTSACSSKKASTHGTLKAMHVPEKQATTAVRVSFSETSTLPEVEQFLIVFDHLYKKFTQAF